MMMSRTSALVELHFLVLTRRSGIVGARSLLIVQSSALFVLAQDF